MAGSDSLGGWRDVGLIEEIPRLGSRVVATARGNVALFRTAADEIFALDDRCPHRGGPISQGIVHGRHVTCPLHNWVIDLATGEAVAPDRGCTRKVPVQIRDRRVSLNPAFTTIFHQDPWAERASAEAQPGEFRACES